MKINITNMLFLAGVFLIVFNPCALAHTDVTPEQAKDLIDSTGDIVVVDVREPSEYCDAGGHIPRALNYPWNSGVLQARYEELPMHSPVLVVCRSGGRSNNAANFLDSQGFTIVYDMLGGMSAWIWETVPCVDPDIKYGGGTGGPDDPYLIYTAEQMNTIGTEPNDWDRHFVLMADIDLAQYTETEFNIVGTDYSSYFSGVFDGRGRKIINLTWDGTDRKYVGLFGYAKGAEIKDLGLESVNINAPDCNNVGGLMGGNDWFCTISKCYVSGSVTGKDKVGVLVGYNMAVVSNCYSQGSVSGNECVGGLVGDNAGGAIMNSFSASSVSGNSKVGGLLGAGGAVTNSFWNVEISGQLTSAGGSGRTTAQMKTADNYLGWNACDDEPVWTLDEGNDYPRLGWQAKPGQPLPRQKLSDFLTGEGTPDEPYLVSTGRQLYLIGLFPCEWDKHFRLTDDIDLADYSDTEFNIIGTHWLYAFTGVLDGQWWRVFNFSWHGTEQNYVGLIGFLGGEIKDLGLRVVDVNAPGCDTVGGLAAVNRGVISNCFVDGDVLGYHRVGGLVGCNDKLQAGSDTGIIRNCYTTGSVSGNGTIGGLAGANMDESTISNSYSQSSVSGGGSNIGGLVGSNENKSIISDSYAVGDVSGENSVGGLVGNNSDESIISNGYASASVTGNGYHIGGLVGYNADSTISNSGASASVAGYEDFIGGLVGYSYNSGISNSYSKSSVSGNNSVGGLIGEGFDCNISNSYSETSVDGNEDVGGLAGGLNGTITNSYSAGFVSGNEYIGGLIGGCSESSVISGSFWDVQSSGQNNMCGRPNSLWCIDYYGKTTAEMQTAATFLEAGWDFVDETENGSEDIWKISDGLNYPRLSWEKYDGGMGVPNDPYLICTAEQLNTVGLNLEDADKHFKLMADIDLSAYKGDSFNRIGFYSTQFPGWYASFTGVFDGNGHTISNFTYVIDVNEPLREDSRYGDEKVGLFGTVYGPQAQIKNLGLIDPNIYPAATCTERVARVGAIAGSLDGGSITNCYVKGGRVSADMNVGGLVGSNLEGTISDCNTTCDVIWSQGRSLRPIERFGNTGYSLGGLVGYSRGWIYNCHATGSVDGTSSTGGLVGANDCDILDTELEIGIISDSYATGDVTGDEGIGGLVGSNGGTISSCYAIGNISGSEYVGGLVGRMMFEENSVNGSYATGNVSGDEDVGGLAGYSNGLTRDSYATGEVSGTTYVGGLIGFNGFGTILRSYADGEVLGDENVGGLVGRNGSGVVHYSYAVGNASGEGSIGGLAGFNLGTINCSYAGGSTLNIGNVDGLIMVGFVTSTVTGGEDVGGLVGVNYGDITHCYSIGTVTGNENVGGLVGDNRSNAIVVSSFWDLETSEFAGSSGGIGRTTAQMKTADTFLDAGWDFLDETANGAEDIWWINEGQDYPRLWWELVEE